METHLELRHLAPYAPYGLIGIIGETKVNLTGLSIDSPFIFTTKSIGSREKAMSNIKAFKPILHPLSDITKEIEVNGEKFVPAIELAKIENKWLTADLYDRIYTKDYSKEGVIQCYLNTASPDDDLLLFIEFYSMDTMDYRTIQKLLEWHFNVFNLPEELWIDINTL